MALSEGKLEEKLKKKCKVLKKGNPKVLEFPMEVDKLSNESIRILTFGKPDNAKVTKTIMMVGGTGTGKSTLLHGMVNFLFGVKLEDDYRFKLLADIEEQKVQNNQEKGQTHCITIYKFGSMEAMCVPYNLVLIDTPGFGDQKGPEHDKEISNQIENLFFTDEYNIKSLSAVGFAVRSSSIRLTPSENYIFDCIQSLFGRDIRHNIFMMITFVDNMKQKPVVLKSLKKANVKFKYYFKFNNSILFNSKDSEDEDEDEEMSSSESETNEENPDFDEVMKQVSSLEFENNIWNLGFQQYKSLFKHVETIEERQLVLTKKVLKLRNQLEVEVCGIQNDIQRGIGKLDELEDTELMILKCQKDIDSTKDFSYTVIQSTLTKVDLPAGNHALVCLTCNHTCHYPCNVQNNEGFKCWAMGEHCDKRNRHFIAAMKPPGLSTRKEENVLIALKRTKETAKCRICPQNCLWSNHKKCTFKYEMVHENVTKKSTDLEKRYNIAKQDKEKAKKLLNNIKSEFETIHLEIMRNVFKLTRLLERLRKIALKPDPITQLEYIEQLIESEKQDPQHGRMERVKHLQTIHERMILLMNILKNEKDPLKSYIEKVFKNTEVDLSKFQADEELRKYFSDIWEQIKKDRSEDISAKG